KERQEAIQKGEYERDTELANEQYRLGTFRPQFLHDPDDGGFPIYGTVPTDVGKLITIGTALHGDLSKAPLYGVRGEDACQRAARNQWLLVGSDRTATGFCGLECRAKFHIGGASGGSESNGSARADLGARGRTMIGRLTGVATVDLPPEATMAG